MTDGSGRYLSVWIAPGTYTITFDLSGFETRTVTSVRLGAGQTVVLDQQLPIEPLTETVQVTAPAPAADRPRAPSAPAALGRRPVRSRKKSSPPFADRRQATDFSQAIGHIVSHRDDPNRQLMGPGDILRIDAGEELGVESGQNLVVRRRFQTGDRSAAEEARDVCGTDGRPRSRSLRRIAIGR